MKFKIGDEVEIVDGSRGFVYGWENLYGEILYNVYGYDGKDRFLQDRFISLIKEKDDPVQSDV